jgi:hypothetical protein
MPNYTRTVSVKISSEELTDILKQHLKIPADAKVTFTTREVSTDYFGRDSRTVFDGVRIEYEEKPVAEKFERGF